jgi:hypothetical protein
VAAPNLRTGSAVDSFAGNANSITFALSSNIQVDDWAFVFVGHNDEAATDITPPSGWSSVGVWTISATAGFQAFKKKMVSGEPGSNVTFTANPDTITAAWVAVSVAVVGNETDATNPVDVVPSFAVTNNSNPGTVKGLTPTVDDCLILGFAFSHNDVTNTSVTEPTGMTMFHQAGAGTTNSLNRHISVFYERLTGGAGNAIADKTATSNETSGTDTIDWIASLISIKPAAGEPPPETGPSAPVIVSGGWARY